MPSWLREHPLIASIWLLFNGCLLKLFALAAIEFTSVRFLTDILTSLLASHKIMDAGVFGSVPATRFVTRFPIANIAFLSAFAFDGLPISSRISIVFFESS